MTIKQIVLAKRPVGLPDLSCFRTEPISLQSMQDGQVHVKALYYSVDPYMRGRMNDTKSYVAPFTLDKPIVGGVVGEVIASKDSNFKLGDFVVGLLPWSTEHVASGTELKKVDANVPLSHYLGILGMPGITAYFGLLDIGKPNANETVVVSGAAGAVGLVVGQIAKILGCKVVGIAGSDEKVKLLKDKFGFDEAINYKTADLEKAIAEACPKGVDVYFDNVGGNISDIVLKNINRLARIIVCGQISMYNAKEAQIGPRLQPLLLTRSATMRGFIVSDYQDHFLEAYQGLSKWLQEGKLIYSETIIDGFEQLPQAFLALFSGKNNGKMIVKASS